jgi:hypothetical protein
LRLGVGFELLGRLVLREELGLDVAEGDLRPLARFAVCFCHVGSDTRGLDARAKTKRPGKSPGLEWITCFRQCQYIRGQREADTDLSVLEIASGHLARLVVTLEVEADLLAFDKVAHSGALDGGDVNEGVVAAIIRLNEAEAFGGIEPFNCASGHDDEPFHSNIEEPQRQGDADGDSDF